MAKSNSRILGNQHPADQAGFTPRAAVYAANTVHTQDSTLRSMMRMIDAGASGNRDSWTVNLGAGTGFTSFGLNAVSNRVIASSISQLMLHQAKQLGQEHKIRNLRLSQNTPEALPFADQSVNMVYSRVSAHHFRDFPKALQEAYRVLRIGGSLLMADLVSPEQDDIASWMNDIELRRDFSHVESRKISTITKILTESGLKIIDDEYQRIYLRFNEWTTRTKMQSEEIEDLRRDFLEAPDATRQAFQVAPVHGNITFSWPCWIFRAIKE